MSDLYLVLRRRLEEVKNWAYIDTDVLRSARDRLGLSYEAMGRNIPTTSKTYERWEKAGRIPVELVDRIADLLDLEIERPKRERTPVAVDDGRPSAVEWTDLDALRAEMARRLNGVEDLLSEILDRLPESDQPQAGEGSGRR